MFIFSDPKPQAGLDSNIQVDVYSNTNTINTDNVMYKCIAVRESVGAEILGFTPSLFCGKTNNLIWNGRTEKTSNQALKVVLRKLSNTVVNRTEGFLKKIK